MKIFSTEDKGFDKALDNIVKRGESDTSKVEAAVKAILNDIRHNGDASLLKYTERFDGVRIKQAQELRVRSKEIQKAIKKIPKKDLKILRIAADRIERFHKKQKRTALYLARGLHPLKGLASMCLVERQHIHQLSL